MQSAENEALEESGAVLSVPEDAVTISDTCTPIETTENAVALVGTFDLPFGSLLWTSSDSFATCLVPTEGSASPLAQVALLFFGSGQLATVLAEAVGENDGYDIYDARGSDQGLIWTEANILDGIWRIYAAPLSEGVLGEPVLLDEGAAAQWETPSIAAVGQWAFWQVLPTVDGDYSSSDSLLKRMRFGETPVAPANLDDEGEDGGAHDADGEEPSAGPRTDSAGNEVLWASTGRFCTAPYPLADSLVITPRNDVTSINYQLTLLDADSGEVRDSLVLPGSMRPLEAGWGDNGFMFSFDATYDYGGGIANLGTYTPAVPHDTEAYEGLQWFRYARNPTAAPLWSNGFFVVKSNMQVVVIDIANMAYVALPLESGCDDWGDYLASTGNLGTFATYTSIDDHAVDGTETRVTRVRVWQPVIPGGGQEVANILEAQEAAAQAEEESTDDGEPENSGEQ